MENHDVVIIGAGPAGLATALALHKQGIKDVVVLEREAEAGGVPRHCGHIGFSFTSRRGILSGPKFVSRLSQLSQGIEIRTATTVLEFTLSGSLRVHSALGISEISAKRIVLATGTREASPAARMIAGNHVAGVINTGTLQQLVYLQNTKPFSSPVILGSEWVSFSAMATCRHAGMRPVALLAEGESLGEGALMKVPRYFAYGAKYVFGVPVLFSTRLIAVHGKGQVEAVEVETQGKRRMIDCDGVIVSGKFRSENALYSAGFLERDGFAPKITDQFKTSRANIYAVGNVLDRLEMAGQCFLQGDKLAAIITSDLK